MNLWRHHANEELDKNRLWIEERSLSANCLLSDIVVRELQDQVMNIPGTD